MTRWDDTHIERCQLCNGTGWADTTPAQAHRGDGHCPGTPGRHKGDDGCFCTASAPCRCSAGRRRVPVHARILESNAKDNR